MQTQKKNTGWKMGEGKTYMHIRTEDVYANPTNEFITVIRHPQNTF